MDPRLSTSVDLLQGKSSRGYRANLKVIFELNHLGISKRGEGGDMNGGWRRVFVYRGRSLSGGTVSVGVYTL